MLEAIDRVSKDAPLSGGKRRSHLLARVHRI
jgi:hypothetical protein